MADNLQTPVKGTVFEKTKNSILYLGKSTTGEEMWMTADQLKVHTFVSGSTGSGKTEMLINLMANTMAWGSGAVFIDGKGDVATLSKLHVIAKALGREDDLLLLNFMNGNVGKDAFISHTVNPFGVLTADELCQIMAGMAAGVKSADSMWRERAIALMNAVVNSLAYLRDKHAEPMTMSKIRNHLALVNLISLKNRLQKMNVPDNIVGELNFYLESLPGYKEDAGFSQNTTAFEQHGYLSMQWTRICGLLCVQYGHILDVETPDIDIRDVILNRRILVILLPSLERSSSDIQNIGALMVGMIKSMLGQALRSPIEGSWKSVVEDRITNATYPFMVIMDEIGQYLTDGMGMLAQQARSLNIGLVFATQDFDSLYHTNSRETEAILANTNSKVFMKAENPGASAISTVLSTYLGQIAEVKIKRQMIMKAKDQLVRDRLTYISRASKDLAQQLDKLNVDQLELVVNDPSHNLQMLLRGFSRGQMIVTHGVDCIQGVANYIPVHASDSEYQIALPRFAEFKDYGGEVINQAALSEKGRNIMANLAKELVRTDAPLENQKPKGLLPFSQVAENALKQEDLYRRVVHMESSPGFYTSLFEGDVPKKIWREFVAYHLLSGFSAYGQTSSIPDRLRDANHARMAARRAQGQRAPAAKPADIDFLKLLKAE